MEIWNAIFIFHTNRIIKLTDENKSWINKWLPKNALIYVEENLKLFYSDIFMWRVSPHVLQYVIRFGKEPVLEENKSEENEEELLVITNEVEIEGEVIYKTTNTKEKGKEKVTVYETAVEQPQRKEKKGLKKKKK